ncbi:MAG: S9 family peptidase [Novosphingobium sp. 17-62-19]|uniref:prolyl oligopeptidase family serine peptidase n=1 Tax=Novosphingobium sp. 17-62-19 TaxID=1970406 RepID=UPI000BC91AF0|nr:prolyl oligopeptidase family serine peptidase [Novosphingobium sp. 17-62-19]OZA21292.1 MAG: S9 family peptidase [Novosphingobium sp. 17-62-19]HQS98309.1 prolyl oligopeptidase family serine peptidase [Novosphingobium sp.]
MGARLAGVLAATALFASGAVRADDGAETAAAVSPAVTTGSAQKPVVPNRLVLPRSAYPETRDDGLVEQVFGHRVADPYRWLEADPRSEPKVAGWMAQQNALSADYLAKLPQRDKFAARIRSLFDYERYGLPRKAGSRYFYTRNSGLQNQSALWVRSGVAGKQRLLLDPNTWSVDSTLALAQWEPSPSGKYVAFAEQEAGSDWRTLRVVEVGTGKVLGEPVRWANDTEIAWIGDEGFLYSRFPEPKAGQDPRAPRYDKAVWFHRVGSGQASDELVHATPDHPEWSHKAQVTADGRWAVIVSEVSTDRRNAVHLIQLDARRDGAWKAEALVPEIADHWKLVAGMGNKLWFLTDRGAANFHLVSIDLARPKLGWKVVVPERGNTLEGARMIGDRFLLSYLKDGQSVAVMTDRKGQPGTAITLNGIGTASGFGGRPGDAETFYQFTSFNMPPAIYRMDLRSGAVTPFAVPKMSFDPADYSVEQREFASKDGTKVPLYVVRKRSLAQAGKPLPTLLYGYGGFDISLTPGYSPVRMAWLEAGGAFALANIRGGGEFGKAWHEAGRRDKKQNSFDDFIAAGEYLISQGIAAKGGLAVQGSSNGGLLVGAVVNQRPDLFAAANPDVGVMDMLRFDRFTSGRFWVDDYGRPDREEDWRTLRSYSPYHNIAGGTDYPAILVTTGENDDRVVPAHSFKYVAALQTALIGEKPHLLRVEPRAGHGAGKPVDKVIDSGADVLAFLAYWTGLPDGAECD